MKNALGEVGEQENNTILFGKRNPLPLVKVMKYMEKTRCFLFTFVRNGFIMKGNFMIEAVCAWEK